MLHEFEEILFLKPWIKNNKSTITTRFPFFASRFKTFTKGFSTRKFSLIVAEEFVLVSAVAFAAAEWEWYNLLVGVLMAYAFHLLIHLVQFIAYRRYIPAIVTTIVTAPYVIFAIFYMLASGIAQLNLSVIIGVLVFIAIAANLVLSHWIVRIIKF